MSNEKKKKKKLNAPQKKSSAASRQQPAIQKELMKYTQLKDIKNVKETFMKWCEEDTKMGDLIPTQVLSVYDNKLKDSEVADHMNDIRKIHEGGITKTGQTKEATLSMMVRLACKSGLPQEAMKYFQQIPKEKPTGSTDRITPRFRSIIPLLKAYAVMGDIDRCFSFFESELLQLKRTGVLTEKEAIQWEDSCGILLRCVAASKLTEAEKKSKIETVFAQLFSVVPVLHPNGKQKDVILDVATSCNCIPHPKVRVTNGGVAIFPATDPNPNDNVSLSSSTLQKSELEELQALTEQLALEGVPEVFHQQWFHFKKNLLNSNINYKSIIDAANVGHTAQNVSGGAFSHQQIDAVAASVDNPLIVLREHWLRGTTELEVKKKKKKKLPQLKNKKLKCDDPVEAKPCDNNEEEEEEEEEDDFEKINSFDQQLLDQLNEELIVNKSGPQYKKYWEDNNMLLLSPNNINDDWVIMYVALTMMLRGVDNVQVITNDFFRDHYWRMHQHPSLVTWKDRHLTKFFLHDTDRPHPKELAATSASISGGRYRKASFTPPPPFTTSAQRIGRNWFIPTSTIPVTWFAIDMNDGKNTNSIDEVRLLSRT